MSRTINRIELLGRVGTEPELRQTRNGTAVCRLRLATDRRNSGGESQTDWHNLVVWGKTAEAVAEYVQKGDRVLRLRPARLRQLGRQGTASAARPPRSTRTKSSFLDNRNGSGNGRQSDGDQPF